MASDSIKTTQSTTGPDVRTDLRGGIHEQVTKLNLGAFDTDDGLVGPGNPLPITYGRADFTCPGNVTLTDALENDLIAAPGIATRQVIGHIVIANGSGVGAKYEFRDEGGGAIQFTTYVAAGQVASFNFTPYLKQTNTDKKWTVQATPAANPTYVYAAAIKR